MSERITYADVNRIAATISKTLPKDYRLTPNRRNGGVAVDIYRGDDCVSLATFGTARETYTYLQGWRRGQLLERYGTE